MSDQPDVPFADDEDSSEHTPTHPSTPVKPMTPIVLPANVPANNVPISGTRRRVPPTESALPETPPRAYNAPASRQATPTRVTREAQQPPAMPPPAPLYYPPPEAPNMAAPNVRRGAARARRDSGFYLPWWSLLLMLALVGGLAFGALLVVNTLGGQAAPGGATPIVIVITATYTIGPPASPTPIPQPATLTPTAPLPTIVASVTLPPGNFVVGATVQIIGVGPSGLNVRSGPGKQYSAKFLGHDSDKFTLKEGPQSASDEEWWHIQDLGNPNNDGWASRRFLTVLAQ